MKRAICANFSCLVFSLTVCFSAIAEDKINVAFMIPANSDNTFWKNSVAFAQAAAEDLNINLSVTYTAENTYSIKRKGEKLLNTEPYPDYLITGYLSSVTLDHLKIAKEHNIKVLLLNTNISEDEKEQMGLPRDLFPNWIGHMVPDDTKAGYDLANALINKAVSLGLAKNRNKPGIIGLTGANNTNVSYDRNDGLKKRIEQSKDATLHEIRFADWQRMSAERDTTEMLEAHPDTSIIWAASDSMALGAIDALEKRGSKAGKEFIVGGIDWSEEGVKAVSDGLFAATVGGHFMESGFALVMIHDFHNEIDFIDDVGVSYATSMSVLDENNIKGYISRFGQGDWSSIDFRKLSKHHNAKLKKYDFSIEAVLNSSQFN